MMMMMMMCTESPRIACLQEDRHLHDVKVTVVSNLIWKPMGHKCNAGPNPSRLRTLRPRNEADLLPVHKVPVTVQEPIHCYELSSQFKQNKQKTLFQFISCVFMLHFLQLNFLSLCFQHIWTHLTWDLSSPVSLAKQFLSCGKAYCNNFKFGTTSIFVSFSVSNCETSQCQSSLEWVHCWKSLGSPAAVQRFIGKMVSKELSIHHNFRMSCLIILIWRVAKCMTLIFAIIFDMYQWRSNTLPIESSWFVHVGNCSWKISLQP